MELKEILSALQGAETNLKGLLDKQSEEIRKHGETTTKTAADIKAAETRLDQLAADMKGAQERLDGIETKMNRLPHSNGNTEAMSIGRKFIESEAYKSFAQAMDGKSAPVEFKTLTGAPLGNVSGYLYDPERVDQWIRPPERAMRVRDLIPVLQTSQGAIEFVRETGFVNNAAAVPEYVDEADQETRATKPKSSIAFEIIATSVKTIAHWLPATRQIIADAVQLQSYIDSRLVYGLKLTEDQQLLYGDGQGANLQGIMTMNPGQPGGIQQYKWSAGQVGDTKIDAVRRAITRARVVEYPVTGVVLHPMDWEEIELTKGSDSHYIWVTVANGGESRLWRVPVVETTAIQEGEALTGAFSLGTALWDREQAQIRVSDSHKDFFTKNLWAILAEERVVQTIYRPEAFVMIDFDAAPVQVP